MPDPLVERLFICPNGLNQKIIFPLHRTISIPISMTVYFISVCSFMFQMIVCVLTCVSYSFMLLKPLTPCLGHTCT